MQTIISQATSAADDRVLQELHDEMQTMREAEAEALRAFQRAEEDMRQAERSYHAIKERRMDADARFHRANGRQARLSSKLNRGRR